MCLRADVADDEADLLAALHFDGRRRVVHLIHENDDLPRRLLGVAGLAGRISAVLFMCRCRRRISHSSEQDAAGDVISYLCHFSLPSCLVSTMSMQGVSYIPFIPFMPFMSMGFAPLSFVVLSFAPV